MKNIIFAIFVLLYSFSSFSQGFEGIFIKHNKNVLFEIENVGVSTVKISSLKAKHPIFMGHYRLYATYDSIYLEPSFINYRRKLISFPINAISKIKKSSFFVRSTKIITQDGSKLVIGYGYLGGYRRFNSFLKWRQLQN
jgi:hypothetical protein